MTDELDPLMRLSYRLVQLEQAVAKTRIESEPTHDFSTWGSAELMVLNRNMGSPFWDELSREWSRWYGGQFSARATDSA